MAAISMGTNFPPELVRSMMNMVTGHSALANLSARQPLQFVGEKIFTFSLDTEADISADAKALLQLMGSRADPAPLASTEPAEKDGRRSALRALNAQLTTNE